LHRRIAVDAFDRALLAQMDGTRTREGLIAGVGEEIAAGRLEVAVDGAPRGEPEVLLEIAEEKLGRLGRTGFLVG
jgi:methyltransferase-like protein